MGLWQVGMVFIWELGAPDMRLMGTWVGVAVSACHRAAVGMVLGKDRLIHEPRRTTDCP